MNDSPAKAVAAFLGRIFLSAIFLLSGVSKITDIEGTKGYMASRNMPEAYIGILLIGAIAFELAGGAAVLIGFQTRLGAALLILFLIPTTLIFHNWWTFPPEEQQLQMIMFLKNLAIFGGLWLLVAFGPGTMSFDVGRSGPGSPPPS